MRYRLDIVTFRLPANCNAQGDAAGSCGRRNGAGLIGPSAVASRAIHSIWEENADLPPKNTPGRAERGMRSTQAEMKRMGQQTVDCSRCGSRVARDETIRVDERAVCRRCLYGDAEPMSMYPIGYVRNELQRPEERLRRRWQAGRFARRASRFDGRVHARARG